MSEPVTQDFTSCPHWGQGGRYVVDPVTGLRVPVPSEPAAADTGAAAADSDAPPPPETPTKKGK